MSIPKLISPMLDNFNMGDPISEHNGVRCCPAMEKSSDAKYIVKIISVPSNPSQLDALLLSGAYPNAESALDYFKTVTDEILAENRLLEKLSQLDGFIPYENCQIEPMEDGSGFDVYLLSPYGTTLEKHLRNNSMTQLAALNLGLDLCSALGICRQSGYLYANIKPENIYVTAEQGYRIGDLGFLKLNSLKYASLPDRYRSAYTAPEIADAYSELNTTIDVYAVGLVLYQVFNNGQLPHSDDTANAEPFPAPAYADYELSEIILKACAPDPAERWQDPESMGQALVAYMQRNGAHDAPIVPATEVTPAPADTEEVVGSFDIKESTPSDEASTDADPSVEDNNSDPEPPILESVIFTEDENGNLTFLLDDTADEALPGNETDDIPDSVVTEEVSDMLQQADELISHPAPDPVIAPEPIDVPIPETFSPEDASDVPDAIESPDFANTDEYATTSEQEDPDADTLTDDQCVTDLPECEDAPAEDDEENYEDDGIEDEYTEDSDDYPPRKHTGRIWILILALIIIGLFIGGTFFYRHYYVKHIDSIKLEETGDGVLTVLVSSDADENSLTVVYSDTYGVHSDSCPVKDGKAVLTDLAPGTKYTIEVVIDGFHKLTGNYTKSYTTPNEINVQEFTATAGNHSGEIILQFSTDAPTSFSWFVFYTTDDGTVKEESITDNTITVSGLTVGTTYTFSLRSPDADKLLGQTQVSFTAKAFIQAENLTVTGCINNNLQLTWSAPENTTVSEWTVRCTGANGFNETKTVSTTSAEFKVPDDTLSYALEVTAAGMNSGVTTRLPANAVTIADLTVDDNDPTRLVLSWTAHGNIPNGWRLKYSIQGTPQPDILISETSAEIFPVIPGYQYRFILEPDDDTIALGGTIDHTTPNAPAFEGYGIAAADMKFTLCSRPDGSWDRHDIAQSDKRTEFSPEEKLGCIINVSNTYNPVRDEIITLYVIRDLEGNIIDISSETGIWADMWSRGYCELSIPNTPQTPGAYTVDIYFNGASVSACDFIIKN